MEPTSQEPPQATPEQTPRQPFGVEKKSKKPLIITLLIIAFVTIGGCAAAWFWWSNQPADSNTVTDQPANSSQQTKAPEPNTVAYAFRTGEPTVPSNLFWRPADGGEKQDAGSKANVGRALVHGNQILIETYGTEGDAPGILYSSNGGKTYAPIFTGKKPATQSDMGDQITGLVFASDGKSVFFGLLSNEGKNTVKRIFFDKPDVTTDIMTSDARGVFPIAFNVKTQKLVFHEGCFNCDGNFSPTIFSYDVTSKQRSTLIDGTDKHLTVIANKSATRLLVTAPTVDATKTGVNSFFGYYVGAPYTITVYDLESNKSLEPAFTVGSASDNTYVRSGFMADDNTPYYVMGSQILMPGKGEPTLLYEAGKDIHEVFYVSATTVFASVGTYDQYTLNRFGIKTQETKQLLSGDDTSTRIFGITEQ